MYSDDLLRSLTYAVEPGFYSTNWLFLGKAHLKLGEKEKAKEWLQRTVAFNGSFAGDEEDKQVHECGITVITNTGMLNCSPSLHPFSSHVTQAKAEAKKLLSGL